MKSYDLNNLPGKIENGAITEQDAVNTICSFLVNNYKVFNLQKYDEDFRSDLIMAFLENGTKFIQSYNPEMGDFFTFLYCYINSMASTKLRTVCQKNLKETITIAEGLNTLEEKQYNYTKINHHISEIPKAPYSYKTANVNELREIFSNLKKDNCDKKILVLAMKSSFYLTDEQITKICSIYNLNPEDLYKAIQFFKDSLMSKSEKREKAEQRRNFAYYHKKKYKLQLDKLQEDNIPEDSFFSNLTSKKNKHDKNWNKMNNKLQNGYLYLRPTTKSIADVLGICERQVTYYINCAKKEVEEKEQEKS